MRRVMGFENQECRQQLTSDAVGDNNHLDDDISAASIRHFLRRLRALALLRGRRLSLHLSLSVLGRRRHIPRGAVHGFGRRVLGTC